MGRPKLSQRLQDEEAFVRKELPEGICGRCGATLDSYGSLCAAELDEACPGFNAVEAAKQKFSSTYKA